MCAAQNYPLKETLAMLIVQAQQFILYAKQSSSSLKNLKYHTRNNTGNHCCNHMTANWLCKLQKFMQEHLGVLPL